MPLWREREVSRHVCYTKSKANEVEECSSLLTVSDIRDFIRLFDESTVHELSLETGDIKLSLKKAGATVVHESASTHAVFTPALHAEPSLESVTVKEVVEPQDLTNTTVIRSPMVGTFYRASSPQAKPYVEIGARVTPSSVVCIVEAMKLMNEIEADVAGEVIEILVENGQLVEYGQPLFRVNVK